MTDLDQHARNMRRLNSAAVLLKHTSAGVLEADRLAALAFDKEHEALRRIGQRGVRLPRDDAEVNRIRMAIRLRTDAATEAQG